MLLTTLCVCVCVCPRVCARLCLCVMVGEEKGNLREIRGKRAESSQLSGKRVCLLIGWGQFSRGKLGELCKKSRVCLCNWTPHNSTLVTVGARLIEDQTQVSSRQINLELTSSSARQSLLQFDTPQGFFLGGGAPLV